MKKYKILIFIVLTTFCGANAQFTTTNGTSGVMIYNGGSGTDYEGIDYIVVFQEIMPQAEIQYLGAGTSFEWYKFTDTSVSIINQSYISPEAATGYILKIDNSREITLWVIDYSQMHLEIDDVIIDPDFTDVCNFAKLNLTGTIPPLAYQTRDGINHFINREVSVNYQTQNWGTESWITVDTTVIETLNGNSVQVPAPLTNTTFELTISDPFAAAFGLADIVVQSNVYQAIAVKNKLLTTTTTREAENEDQRPDNEAFLEGSAPLDIHFVGNSTAAVTHNQWTILRENQLYFMRNEPDFRYTFSEFGRYKIVLASSNQQCTYTDSVVVKINESALEVPNVFTPNGDGVNDEFRVAHRSLRTFQMAVYNRWGNKIYTSDDPQGGWNGRIGNRDAAAGPYFYYIKAEGTDGKKYVKKGDINLIR
ncbi:MAG: gliding motility-associated C-terminal domain-containing protein [Prevotellaceae bacterium]|nr:gliding motility-associated C-terminal domain-containing protein [Prevotellaceae bacterium]